MLYDYKSNASAFIYTQNVQKVNKLLPTILFALNVINRIHINFLRIDGKDISIENLPQ